jgi:hypothetical protein
LLIPLFCSYWMLLQGIRQNGSELHIRLIRIVESDPSVYQDTTIVVCCFIDAIFLKNRYCPISVHGWSMILKYQWHS